MSRAIFSQTKAVEWLMARDLLYSICLEAIKPQLKHQIRKAIFFLENTLFSIT